MPDNNQPISELDTILVHNPDTNCDFIDPELGYSHKEYFEVKWGGQPHRIKPGQSKLMPRFLAQHFAKHLADHLLYQIEDKTGRKGLLYNPVERPKILSQILVKTEGHFLAEPTKSEGEKAAAMVDELNQEKALDLGVVANPLMPTTTAETPPLSDIMKAAGVEDKPKDKTEPKVSIFDTSKNKPTRKQLMEEAYKMGIDFSPSDNIDTLISKIKKF